MKQVFAYVILAILALTITVEATSIGSVTYNLVQDEGSSLTRRQIINCTGSGITCSDSGGKTVFNVPGGATSAYDTVQNEGTPLTQRSVLNCVGAGITCSDDAMNSATLITVAGGGGTYAGYTVSAGGSFFGPLYPVTIPTDPGTWVNQVGTTLTTNADGTLTFNFPGSADFARHGRVKTIPATPYTATVLVLPNLAYSATSTVTTGCGILLWDQAGTNNIIFGFFFGPSATNPVLTHYVQASQWTDFTTASGSSTTSAFASPRSDMLWLRIVDDGVNRSYQTSTDGQTFLAIGQTTSSDFITPDRIGYFGYDSAANAPYACTILSSTF